MKVGWTERWIALVAACVKGWHVIWREFYFFCYFSFKCENDPRSLACDILYAIILIYINIV